MSRLVSATKLQVSTTPAPKFLTVCLHELCDTPQQRPCFCLLPPCGHHLTLVTTMCPHLLALTHCCPLVPLSCQHNSLGSTRCSGLCPEGIWAPGSQVVLRANSSSTSAWCHKCALGMSLGMASGIPRWCAGIPHSWHKLQWTNNTELEVMFLLPVSTQMVVRGQIKH